MTGERWRVIPSRRPGPAGGAPRGYSLRWTGSQPLAYLFDGWTRGWYLSRSTAQAKAAALNAAETAKA